MDIVCTGAGNVATHLVKALHEKGYHIRQIVSRNAENGRKLADAVHAEWSSDASRTGKADLYLYCVSDDALAGVIARNPHADGLHVHTAGSIPLSVFAGRERCGVLYPLQTFSKEKPVDFSSMPIFLEASSDEDMFLLKKIAGSLSCNILQADSAQRQALHLSAVFACNFTNHLLSIADDLLRESGLPFGALLPLITETIGKATAMAPKDAQTGPAVRNDHNVMQKHLQALSGHPSYQKIYSLLSGSIAEMNRDRAKQ
jgi:predicted short-subunit dehydrogenase-like oxidoreductase (DUF2520 family)